MNAEDNFKTKAPWWVQQLMRDFHITDYQAAGIVGNIGRECLGFTAMREIGASPGAGGYGVCQWTGLRAHEFLDYCHRNKVDWRSDAGNYGFLKSELQGIYRGCIGAVAKAKTLYDATVSFERSYERAGVPAYNDRFRWADLALKAFHAHDAGV